MNHRMLRPYKATRTTKRGGRWRSFVRPCTLPDGAVMTGASGLLFVIRAAETIQGHIRSFRMHHSTDRWGKPAPRLVPVLRLRGLPTPSARTCSIPT